MAEETKPVRRSQLLSESASFLEQKGNELIREAHVLKMLANELAEHEKAEARK